MAKTEAYICDVCGKQKGEVNHWWLVDDFLQFQMFTWNDKTAAQENMKHICGQECAAKKMSQWMENANKQLGT